MEKLKVSWNIKDEMDFFKQELEKPDKIVTKQKVEGYWKSDLEPDYPMPIPNILTDEEANEICNLIKEKEKTAIKDGYMGDSFSRLTGEILNNKEYKLNDWIWTGDFAEHYVLKYKVRPTNAFLKFIEYKHYDKNNLNDCSYIIKYNNLKTIHNNMVEQLSKEIDKEIIKELLSNI